MLFLDLEGLALLALVLFWVWAIIDVIATDESVVRNLPKLLWLMLVIVLPEIGSLVWLLLGRPHGAGFWPGGGSSDIGRPGSGSRRRQPGFKGTGPYGPDSAPRYLPEYDITDRRSQELDALLDRQLGAGASSASRADDLAAWEADLRRREEELRRREQGS